MAMLKVNKEINMAVMDEDNIGKGIDIIQANRGLINRGQQEVAMNQRSIKSGEGDLRGQAVEKVMVQLERSFKKIIEKIG